MITNIHQWDFIPLSMILPLTITQFIYAQPLPIRSSPITLTDDRVWDHHAGICLVNPLTILVYLNPMRLHGGL